MTMSEGANWQKISPRKSGEGENEEKRVVEIMSFEISHCRNNVWEDHGKERDKSRKKRSKRKRKRRKRKRKRERGGAFGFQMEGGRGEGGRPALESRGGRDKSEEETYGESTRRYFLNCVPSRAPPRRRPSVGVSQGVPAGGDPVGRAAGEGGGGGDGGGGRGRVQPVFQAGGHRRRPRRTGGGGGHW